MAAGEDVAVAGLEMTKMAASEVVEALEVHHSVAARQPLQTMKKNGIRSTKELLKASTPKSPNIIHLGYYYINIIILYLSALIIFVR